MFKLLVVFFAALFAVALANPAPVPVPRAAPAPIPVANPNPAPQLYYGASPYAYSGYYASPTPTMVKCCPMAYQWITDGNC